MARLAGIRGSVYLADSVTKLADAYQWEFEENQEVLDASIKGERFRRYVADQGHGRVRVMSKVSSAAATPLSSGMNADLVTAAGAGVAIDFVLHMVDGTATVTGQGYVVRSQLHVGHDGEITDEIEIEVDGIPTVA
jgi:hypothetical protein